MSSSPFRDAPRYAWALLAFTVAILAASIWLGYSTIQIRFRRDVNRIVFNRNWDLLERVKREAGIRNDSLQQVLASSPAPSAEQPYIVVSIADRRLWYKKGDETLYTTRVAVGSGKTLVKHGGRSEYKFDTPRGRLVVQSKEADPVWVPPDWHYLELARRKGLGLLKLTRGQTIATPDGAVVTVSGNDVVKRFPDGREVAFGSGQEGKEIIAGGNVIVPPFGTNQRKYVGVLGTHRLNLGDGYALHGTDTPASIGHAVSHGCVRLRNEDIDYLYSSVATGTPVYIY
ncbi:MAG TPA: L,D-transpeptidase [Gemmatimonadaceae bacterium]|nr:L,D-transpeptidase [Gemmatimonadaceae bacterium]